MLLLRRPSRELIDSFLRSQQAASFSYHEVGMTAGASPSGFVLDQRQMQLGMGERSFAAARQAVRDWKMFTLPWVELAWPDSPIAAGTVVAVAACVAGIWVLGACRIVYVIEEPRRFGFAYGTLAHMEQGEERFLVEWRDDDTVWYDLLAFSRPGVWFTRLGYPYARYCQKSFGTGSLAAMRRATESAA